MKITNMENISNLFWEHIENSDTKISKKIYEWLSRDNLNAVILDDKVFWFELTTSYCVMPNYIYEYMKKWGRKLGYTYLYDIKENK